MKIQTRSTHGFVDLKVDMTEDTIYKRSTGEISETVSNLLSVIDELLKMVDKEIIYKIKNR